MKVVIVSSFDTYEVRVNMIYEFFKERNDDVFVVTSDFCHVQKAYRQLDRDNYILIHTKEYMKNISFARMKSHHCFAKNAFKLVNNMKPDIIYVLLPANSLVKQAALYKKRHKNIKLIFDVIDLWPESIPIGRIKNYFPFTLWKNIRDNNIIYADYVITECSLFADKLCEVIGDIPNSVLYFPAKKIKKRKIKQNIELDDTLSLAYIGSINNIIDIDAIANIITNVKKKVILHIIGDGEKREEFISKMKQVGAIVKYYGKVYDDDEKYKILEQCEFGLNIMKSTVCIGLTMKSIEYFRYGLPIINNIQGDTYKLVEDKILGINIQSQKSIFEQLETFDYIRARSNIQDFFNDYLSEDSFKGQLEDIMLCIL